MKKAIVFGIVMALAACGGKSKGGSTPDNKSAGSGSAMAPMGGQGYGGSAAPAAGGGDSMPAGGGY